MTPYYQDDYVMLYCGDAGSILPHLTTCHAVITDPPYNLLAEDISLDGRAPMKRDFGAWDQDWHPSWLLTQAFRVLPKGGSLLAFTSDRLLSAWREAAAWTPRGTIVWQKTNPAPHPRPAYVNACEWIVWLQKPGAAATWNGDGYTPNILTYASVNGLNRFDHPTQKPEGLIAELIARHTGEGQTILDPFAGTGTTLAAAKRNGRKAIGIEINEAYAAIAARRLSQGVLEFA